MGGTDVVVVAKARPVYPVLDQAEMRKASAEAAARARVKRVVSCMVDGWWEWCGSGVIEVGCG